jgi:hypothetical protein
LHLAPSTDTNRRLRPSPWRARYRAVLAGVVSLMLVACAGFDPLLGPVADAGVDRTVTVGEAVELDGSGSVRAETFAWSFDARPAGSAARLEPDDEPLSAFVADVAGLYVVRLTVGDGLRFDSDTLTVEARPPASPLAPDGLHLSDDGVVLAALPGTLDAAIGVFASEAGAPGVPPPAGVEVVGPYYRIGSSEGAFGDARPFVVALPVPDGVDTSQLALLHQVLPEDVTGTYLTGPTWELLTGVFDPRDRYFLTTIAGLAAGGRIVALVTGERLRSESVSRSQNAALVTSDHDVAFVVDCVNFDVPSVNNRNLTCGAGDEADLEGVLEGAFHDFVGLGFPKPYLQREIDPDGTSIDLQSGLVTVVFGAYRAELRPFRNVAANESRWPCGTSNGITNLGGYSTGSMSFFVCIGLDGVFDAGGNPTGAVDTARHEYFHATQYAYPNVRSRASDLWVIEGTAVASENSLATMQRNPGRALRPVDAPLAEVGDTTLVHYRAQDFFVFAGRELGQGLGYLRSVFERGGRTADVDAGLRNLGFTGGLGEMYRRWTRDQLQTNAIAAAIDGCRLATAIATPVLVPLDSASPATTIAGSVAGLGAEVVHLEFAADPLGYPVAIRLAAPLPSGLHLWVFDGANCVRNAELGLLDEFRVEVPGGGAWNAIVLVSNTTVGAAADLGFALEVTVEPAVAITSPPKRSTLSAGEALELRATIFGSEPAVRALPIHWYVTWSRSTPGLTFSSLANETLLAARHDPYCSRSYEIEASIDAFTVSGRYGRPIDQTQIDLVGRSPEPLRAVVTAPQRQVHHLELREASPGVYELPAFTLRGFAAKRRCDADGLSDATARWLDHLGRVLAEDTFAVSHTLDPALFDNGAGAWVSRWLLLEVRHPGEWTARRDVLVAPCFGREDDGGPRLGSVPPCPAEIDGFFYDLDRAFETLSKLPSLQEVLFELNGLTRDLEDVLGLGKPGFPIRDGAALDGLDADTAVIGLLADLRDALTVSAIADAEARLRDLDDRARNDKDLVDTDLTLFWLAHGIAGDTLHAFKTEAEAFSDVEGAPGGGAWSRPAFVRDTDLALAKVDPVAPARGAVQGFLTSANFRAPTHPIHLRAATLAALVYAGEELERAGY